MNDRLETVFWGVIAAAAVVAGVVPALLWFVTTPATPDAVAVASGPTPLVSTVPTPAAVADALAPADFSFVDSRWRAVDYRRRGGDISVRVRGAEPDLLVYTATFVKGDPADPAAPTLHLSITEHDPRPGVTSLLPREPTEPPADPTRSRVVIRGGIVAALLTGDASTHRSTQLIWNESETVTVSLGGANVTPSVLLGFAETLEVEISDGPPGEIRERVSVTALPQGRFT